jgi:hypothetical protein
MKVVVANDQLINNSDKREIENKLKEYVSGFKTDFITNVSNSVKDLVLLQQNYIQYIRKANLIISKTDGVMNSNNEPQVYDISGDTEDQFTQLVDYLEKITLKHEEFYKIGDSVVEGDNLLYLADDKYTKISSTFNDDRLKINDVDNVTYTVDLMSDNPANRFYQVMAHILNDDNSRNELKTFILNSQNYSDTISVTDVVDKAITECAGYNKYTEINKKRYDEIKTKPLYLQLIKSPLENNVKFGLKYTKVSGTSQQKNDIKDLYSSVNINNKEKTFDGKVKFN